MTPALHLLLACIGAELSVAVLAVALGRHRGARVPVYGATLALAACAAAVAFVQVLAPPDTPPSTTLPLGLPWLGAQMRLDSLSAFFLVVVNLGGALASLYAIGHGRHETAPHRVLPFFPAFLAGMNLVVLADDAFTFLFSWELMSVASWALVVAHHRTEGTLRAGYVYLVMAALGTLSLLLAFGLLAGPDGAFAFAAMRAAEPGPAVAALVLIFALLGAGSKAGLVPVHVWLPLAHPAAPSPVSALMSGVMTKVAVYGFIRIVFDLLGQPSWWAAMLVLFLGGATALLGVLYALMQHDLKRLLAYHTVENIGIIFIGLGLALAFQANAMGQAAALAVTAALFHVLNHALFKSLLFFGAGAVLTATRERDMEHLGGLDRRMPLTGFLFLVGCVAISALPPLNGFVSEWLTFQAILQSPALPEWGLKIMVPGIGGVLALSAALAAACFVKAYGVTFLGRPRTPAVERADEADAYTLAAMAILAGLCLVAGILPSLVIDLLAPVADALVGDRLPAQTGLPWLSVTPVPATGSTYNGLLVGLFIALSAGCAAGLIHRLAGRRTRRGPAWDCGFPLSSPAAQYSAGSFTQPIRRVFNGLAIQARETVDMPAPGDPRPARLTVTLQDILWDTLYAPVSGWVARAADRLNGLQFLTIRRYLGLVFLSLVSLLLVIALWL